MATWQLLLVLSIFVIYAPALNADDIQPYFREVCHYRKDQVLQPVSDFRRRLKALREQLQIRATVMGPELDGYILPSWDEHLNAEVAERDRRLHYLTGFTGINAFAAITAVKAAMWVENRYLRQADGELDCEWEIYRLNGTSGIVDWLRSKLFPEQRVGADPNLVPHYLWKEWQKQFEDRLLVLRKISTNLVDYIWGSDRPKAPLRSIQVQQRIYAGQKWESKVTELRIRLMQWQCDAIVVTSLTEIAWLLNIRGKDIPYTPVVKSYLIISKEDIFFYVDRLKINLGIDLHLHTDCYNEKCVKILEYDKIWSDLRTYAQLWKRVMIPAPCVQELGATEAIYSALPEKVLFEHISPIIFMRAQKTHEEQAGMQLAHIKDGAAICEAMSNLEMRFHSEQWTEESIRYEIDRSRLTQDHAKGLSLRTVVAFGEHSSYPYYISSNVTDVEVTERSVLVIESGGQYYEGTTDVSRTFTFGQPTAEMKQAYTNVLAGILRLSQLKFPSNIKPSEVDALVRSPVWESMSDYPQVTGHGIGAYGSVQEPPIAVSYGESSPFYFYEGYFFSAESGFYKPGEFGVRLKNVLQVVDPHRVHPSGVNFMTFADVTLVPYESKLIDSTLLSAAEKRFLNSYNANIRQLVGEELKRQGNMQAFYWMMNKTRHIREYLPEDEYRAAIGGGADGKSQSLITITVPAILLGLTTLALNSFSPWLL